MSSAVYPLGMKPTPASGYTKKSTFLNKQYVTWKGTGINRNPVGTAPGHIRPLTNNDPGNVFQTGFGLPRPIKHFRKGRVIVSEPVVANDLIGVSPDNGSIPIVIDQEALINYNMNRFVKSSKGTSLGGGFGGSGLLNEMQDKPGAFSVSQNTSNEGPDIDCNKCQGVGIVASYYPNNFFLQENPEKNTQNSTWCCNAEVKAKRRSIYASTNLKKNYFTTNKEYLQNRCKTYDQKAFNFLFFRTNTENPESTPYFATTSIGPTPGSPLSLGNTYLANCQPGPQIFNATQNALITQMLAIMLNLNILTQEEVDEFNNENINTIQGFFDWINKLPEEQRTPALEVFTNFISNPYWGMPLSGPSNPNGCQLVVYKPSNYKYAKQGAVDSSTRNLKLMVDTISTNAASLQNYNNTGPLLVNANELYQGNDPSVTNLYKVKMPECNAKWPLNFYQSGRYQNKKICHYSQLPEYQIPASQPSPYRYFPSTYKSSNHFSQSPNTYNTTTGK